MMNGRIKQTLPYWCLNATQWQWNIERSSNSIHSHTGETNQLFEQHIA